MKPLEEKNMSQNKIYEMQSQKVDQLDIVEARSNVNIKRNTNNRPL